MEYMRLDGFLGKQVSKILNRALKEKMGFDPDVLISSLSFKTTENGLVELNLNANMKQNTFEKLIEEVTK